MLDRKGFDLWADGYDKSVNLSDDDGSYPFAGYKQVLNAIYQQILGSGAKSVLDIGFGTGTLSKKLYDQGISIYGQDFSEKMFAIAREKMPKASLYQGDISLALVPELREHQYDAIVATYSLHHLDDGQKIILMKDLMSLLNPGGQLLIGDVAFQTRDDLEQCRIDCGDGWDEDEIYFVANELTEAFPTLQFEILSHCAGVLRLIRE